MSGIPELPISESAQSANRPTGTEKRCTKCGVPKPLRDFPTDKARKDGRASGCRVCGRVASKRWADGHGDSIRQRCLKNKDHIAARNRARWIAKKDMLYEQHQEWVANNPGKMTIYSRAWRERHYEHAKDLGRKAAQRRLQTPEGKLKNAISKGMRQAIIKGSKGRQHWESLVGYTVDKLRRHLEKQFQPGMSWENYGKWHIDHKIPVKAFNFSSPQDLDFKRCWALKNLQPLWRFANQSKHDRVDSPFQPSLLLSA